MHYYQHHIGDFLKDTGHLSNDQLAVYLKMLWRYYLNEKPFSDTLEDLAFSMGSDEKTVHIILRHFFVLQENGWNQTRCNKEILNFHSKAESARNSANARWSNANALQTQSKRNAKAPKNDANQEPRTNNHIEKPPSVSQEVWDSFLVLRKTKKAPVSILVMKKIVSEATDAGWTVEAALEEMVVRNWISFKAEWVAKKATFADQQKEKDRQEYLRMVGRKE